MVSFQKHDPVRSEYSSTLSFGSKILRAFSLGRNSAKWSQVVAGLFGPMSGGSLPPLADVLTQNRVLRELNPGSVKLGDADQRAFAAAGVLPPGVVKTGEVSADSSTEMRLRGGHRQRP